MGVQFTAVEHGSDLYLRGVRFRQEILRTPLKLAFSPEDISEEREEFHFLGIQYKDEIVASASLKKISSEVMKMRQVAVLPTIQKSGIGQDLVAFVEGVASGSLGCVRMELHARETVLRFYQKQGYSITGDGFFEVGLPHRKMFKDLV